LALDRTAASEHAETRPAQVVAQCHSSTCRWAIPYQVSPKLTFPAA
jgi:hypothetical protein